MADRTDGGPIMQRFAVFRDPENPPDSWRSWSAYTRDFNVEWRGFAGFYEGHGDTRRARKADAIRRARIDAMTKAAPPPAPRDEKCPKCKGTGIHILADVPGEGRIVGGRCPSGCAFPPAPRDDDAADAAAIQAALAEPGRIGLEALAEKLGVDLVPRDEAPSNDAVAACEAVVREADAEMARAQPESARLLWRGVRGGAARCIDAIQRIPAAVRERERDEARELRALLTEVRDAFNGALGMAEAWESDDQVGCLCIGDCYCKSGRLREMVARRDALNAKIDAALRGGEG